MRDANLRGGHIKEDLGIVLLRGMCAVAQVPHPEDTGIDAVCTLLRPEDSRRLIAGRTVHVQIKSHTKRRVTYSGEAAEWLRQLELPLFFATVSVSDGIRLYSLHRALQYLGPEFSGRSLELCFDGYQDPDLGSPKLRIGLGCPIAAWNTGTIDDVQWRTQMHPVLDAWFELETRNNQLRRLSRSFYEASWVTNEAPETSLGPVVRSTSNINQIVNALPELVCSLGLSLLTTHDREAVECTAQFLRLLQRLGADNASIRPIVLALSEPPSFPGHLLDPESHGGEV